MIQGHLIIDEPRDGAVNMAIDQVLLESVSAGTPPVLRFYQWAQPTLSLGYFQSLADRDTHAASKALPVVRRSTGGGAIIHDRELTYSLSLPWPNDTERSNLDIYRAVHEAIIGALGTFGVQGVPHRLSTIGPLLPQVPPPFLCFQRRTDEDLLVHGYKVLGSAQRRIQAALLQHGSILLTASIAAPELPGIETLTGLEIPIAELSQSIARFLEPLTGIHWIPHQGRLFDEKSVEDTVTRRFGSRDWTGRR